MTRRSSRALLRILVPPQNVSARPLVTAIALQSYNDDPAEVTTSSSRQWHPLPKGDQSCRLRLVRTALAVRRTQKGLKRSSKGRSEGASCQDCRSQWQRATASSGSGGSDLQTLLRPS